MCTVGPLNFRIGSSRNTRNSIGKIMNFKKTTTNRPLSAVRRPPRCYYRCRRYLEDLEHRSQGPIRRNRHRGRAGPLLLLIDGDAVRGPTMMFTDFESGKWRVDAPSGPCSGPSFSPAGRSMSTANASDQFEGKGVSYDSLSSSPLGGGEVTT